MKSAKSEHRNPNSDRSRAVEGRNPEPENGRRPTSGVTECGGKRSATPLWLPAGTEANEENEGRLIRYLCSPLWKIRLRTRRLRAALPAHSKTGRTCGARDSFRFNARRSHTPRSFPAPAACPARSVLKFALLALGLLTASLGLRTFAQDHSINP